ncbi:pentapeptide repeat-containing protein [Dyella sp. BiH032]|uniref:pentapeptide repeat-containing protein n=1 Tax=Dyella sp. BiH032 TaxID=3075430 RepID=UPI0028937C3D|nr:pentapeptide repeat-containing protein [Dyella sp. BiH032]WNL46740.1 pentapeptide repeat-containing protein [Dyella sp. BiH032]
MSADPFDQRDHTGRQFRDIHRAGATLEGLRFDDCRFEHCDFSEATLRDCRFRDCEFVGCNFSLARLAGSQFGARFTDSKLVGIDWTQAHWPAIRLGAGIAFERCALNDSSFFGLSLRELALIECRAHDVDFTEADLEDADFRHSDLRGAIFRRTRLARADFRDATDYRIDVLINDVKRAKFSLPEAVSLLYGLDIDLTE